MEQDLISLRNFAESLQEPIAAHYCEVELKSEKNLCLCCQNLFFRERVVSVTFKVAQGGYDDLLVVAGYY